MCGWLIAIVIDACRLKFTLPTDTGLMHLFAVRTHAHFHVELAACAFSPLLWAALCSHRALVKPGRDRS